jgi:hypothetical protein
MAEVDRAIPDRPREWRPICSISFSTPAPERARLWAELQLVAQGAPILQGGEEYGRSRNVFISYTLMASFPRSSARWMPACPKTRLATSLLSRSASDVMHDLLAFLAERMLEMNKNKQQEIRGFLGWLDTWSNNQCPIVANLSQTLSRQ